MKANHSDEKMELDLDNPIFVCYLNTEQMPRQRMEETIQQVQRCFQMYVNITVWIFPSDRNQIDCLWKGKYSGESLDKISATMDRFKDLIKLTPTEFKKQIRDILIDDLTNEVKMS